MKKIKFYSLWLSLILIMIFFLQKLIFGFTDLFILNKSAIYNYEYWRFLTAIFLHGSMQHLLYNLFALLFFGLIGEKLIGSSKFLVVFLGSGIIANIISANFYNSSLGASGAIMGIIGIVTIIRPLMMVWTFGLILPMFLAAILWIIGDVLGIFMPSNVGNIAHLSGIATGFLLGFIFRLIKKNQTQNKFNKIKIPEAYIREWEKNYIK